MVSVASHTPTGRALHKRSRDRSAGLGISTVMYRSTSHSSFTTVRVKSLHMLTLFALILLSIGSTVASSSLSSSSTNHWQEQRHESITPRRRIHLRESEIFTFTGNDSSVDYFKYLDRDGDSLLIGARNVVYNISLSTLKENRRLQWYSSDEDVQMCKYKGKTDEACQNYIKVLAKLADDRVLICGTNAFKPKCRSYQIRPIPSSFLMLNEKSGEALCPYDPTYSSTATFYEKNLYVATVAGFSGADPLIYREPLRTEQYNPKHLNAPTYVNSFPHGGHVYFFFRETAVEYINCGKAVYSRVARVCARDKGGPHKFRNRWTSFSKARLNCSIPGDFPFYFDEIQATTPIIRGVYGGRSEQLIYAIFNTPENSIQGSAVCAFRIEDLDAAFRGPFKGTKDIDSNWLSVSPSRVPSPRPGECHNDSQSLPEMTVNFIKEHPLMDQAVPAFLGAPLLLHTSFKARYTAIAVHPQVETVGGRAYDIFFIGTSNGRVIKALNAASNNGMGEQYIKPVVVEEIVVFPNGAPVTQIIVHHTFYEQRFVAISQDTIRSAPLFTCRAKTCGECVRLQDPYCAWDIAAQKCVSARSSRFWSGRENFVQSIEQGWDPRCPDRPTPPSEEQETKEGEYSPNSLGAAAMGGDDDGPSAVPIYSGETFALAVVTSVVSSLVFGFIIGYIFSRRCRKADPGMCSPYDDHHTYLDPHSPFGAALAGGHPGLTRLAGHGPTMGALYGAHPGLDPYGTVTQPMGTLTGAGGKPINLVLNVAQKSNSKNANSSADNQPMMQKVKKIYL